MAAISIKPSSNGYSFFRAIEARLNQPLIRTVMHSETIMDSSVSENIIVRICQIAWHFFYCTLLITISMILSLIGRCISIFSHTQINRENLHLKPEIPEIREEMIEQDLDITEIAQKFEMLGLVETNPMQTPRAETLKELCNRVLLRDQSVVYLPFERKEEFYKELHLYLKAILQKLNSNDIDNDYKKRILTELADASRACFPTWLEVAYKNFSRLYQAQDAKGKLLSLVQEYKELLILDIADRTLGMEWHALNSVRNSLGDELGLQISVNEFDPYVSNSKKSTFNLLFSVRYDNTNDLLSGICNMINSRPYDSVYYDFLLEIVTQQGCQDAFDFIAKHYFDLDGKINLCGVGVMLKQIGILD